MTTATRIFTFVFLTFGFARAMEQESRIPEGMLKRATAAYTASQTKNVGADFVLANHLVPYECLERQLLGTSPPAEQTDEEKRQHFLARRVHREIVARLVQRRPFALVSENYPSLMRTLAMGTFMNVHYLKILERIEVRHYDLRGIGYLQYAFPEYYSLFIGWGDGITVLYGMASDGLEIRMVVSDAGKIITAYPVIG